MHLGMEGTPFLVFVINNLPPVLSSPFKKSMDNTIKLFVGSRQESRRDYNTY